MGVQSAACGNICKLLMYFKNLSVQVYCLLLFCHVRPGNQTTVTGVVLCRKKFGRPCIKCCGNELRANGRHSGNREGFVGMKMDIFKLNFLELLLFSLCLHSFFKGK